MSEKLDTDGWCCDDHVVRPGDSPGQWHLYDLHEFNDGPPFATFYADEDAEKRARFCANALHQLADKERELTAAGNTLVDLDQQLTDKERELVTLKESFAHHKFQALEQQLADKERELVARNKYINEIETRMEKRMHELTAANAVVETLQRDCAAIGMRYSLKTIEALNKWRKLQGGDGDE